MTEDKIIKADIGSQDNANNSSPVSPGSVGGSPFCRRCESLAEWKSLQSYETFYDTILKLPSGTEMKVNRTLLSAFSEYFRASFTYSSHNSSNPEAEKNVLYVNASDGAMSSILDFVNNGSCDISWSNVEELLPIADRYAVLGLIRQCCQFLIQELRDENCIGIYLFARTYLQANVEYHARQCVLRCFAKIAEENDDLNQLSFEELHSLLADDRLNVEREETTFQVIKTWVMHDVDNRKDHLPQLLSCIRMKYKSQFMSWTVIENSLDCQKVLKSLMSKSRLPCELIFTVGGWSNGSPTNIVEVYDRRANRWWPMDHVDYKRAYPGVVAYEQKIYVLGGFDGDSHFNWMRCFDPITFTWEEKPCMYQARCYVCTVVHDKKIYAIGGYNGHYRLNSAERFNFVKNQWEQIAPMNQARSDAGAAVMGDNIYVVGGFNGLEVLNSCEIYNVPSNTWTLFEFLVTPRSGVGVISVKESIYAIGGYNGRRRLKSVEKYSVNTTGWSLTGHMSTSRSNFSVVTINNEIYIIGGYNGSNTINLVERFDPEFGTWKILSPLNVTRSGHGACVLTDLPNIEEYCSCVPVPPDIQSCEPSHSEISDDSEDEEDLHFP